MLPFQGLRVIDFTHVLAGPACSYYLGLLGAQVIKIESPDRGDAIRHRGGTDKAAAAAGMSTPYLTQGAGKSSIALDLETADGQSVLHKLLAGADIFVENHVPETMRRLKLDEGTIRSRHPHLVHCAMTGYGRGGPQENTPAYDVNIQASCGLMDATGTDESGPIRVGAPVLDYATAMAASFAISAALFDRSKTGKGCFVDVSMLETGLSLMSSTITDYFRTGNAPKRRGNLANSRSPGAGTFPCKSGMLSLGVNEEAHFRNLARALGRDDWLGDPRFASRAARNEHAETLVNELQRELHKDTAENLEERLQTAGVPCARLRSLPEALASDQVRERDFVHTMDEDTKVPTLPFRLGCARAHAPSRGAPLLGEQSEDVLRGLTSNEE